MMPTLHLLTQFAAGFCAGGGAGAGCSTGLPQVQATSTQLHVILQIVFGVIAALSVLFVVIGGLRFIVSEGDPQDTSKARSTIVYALVGLLISLVAEAIVSFVLSKL